MGRPSRVYPNSLHKYDKLHTRKIKMYCGTEITGLHLVKETDQFNTGFMSWAFCCDNFKALKSKPLQYNVPVLTDLQAINFLDKHAWHDWIDKELKGERKGNEMAQTLVLLDRLFPEKKKVYFYELKSLIATFCHGSFINYNDDGTIEEPNEFNIEQRAYYTGKYKRNHKDMPQEIKTLYDAYSKISEGDKIEKEKAFEIYHKAERKYIYDNFDLTLTFIEICKNSVVCPYAFTNPTVAGSEYEHAGEVYFIVTPDTIYFETERHF